MTVCLFVNRITQIRTTWIFMKKMRCVLGQLRSHLILRLIRITSWRQKYQRGMRSLSTLVSTSLGYNCVRKESSAYV